MKQPRETGPLKVIAENPRAAVIVLSFLLMPVVYGLEWLEGTQTFAGLARNHRAALAIVKQALSMAAIPGIVLLIWGGEMSRWTNRERWIARAAAAAIGLSVGYVIVFRFTQP